MRELETWANGLVILIFLDSSHASSIFRDGRYVFLISD